MKLGGASRFLRTAYREFNEDQVLTYAAALAYHSLLALFPFLLFLLALVSFLNVPALFEQLLVWGRAVLPPQGLQEITATIAQFQSRRNTELLSLGMVGAVWAASGGVRAAIDALNTAYDVEERRPLWKRYLLSLVFTLGLGLLILLSTGLLLVGPRAAQWLAGMIGLPDVVPAVWRWARYPFAIGILVVVTAVVYSTFPNVRGFRLLTPGAVFTVLLWILFSIGFQLYLEHFGRYNVLYGSIGAVIVLLLYLWLSAIVLLAGGELNAILAHSGFKSVPQPGS